MKKYHACITQYNYKTKQTQIAYESTITYDDRHYAVAVAQPSLLIGRFRFQKTATTSVDTGKQQINKIAGR